MYNNKNKMIKKNNILIIKILNNKIKILQSYIANPNVKNEILDIFDCVTILFADIAGFTKFSSTVTIQKVVQLLNEMFIQFDKSCLKYNVYKLYTIGDCYVVLGLIDADSRNPI